MSYDATVMLIWQMELKEHPAAATEVGNLSWNINNCQPAPSVAAIVVLVVLHRVQLAFKIVDPVKTMPIRIVKVGVQIRFPGAVTREW